ncbi:MAG: DUF502 domain-containing protein [Candidatus Omnitrophica bacterium]|nr:DUF502 domain-containing protein [Candidatus Omnitrophota bacterium]
MNQNINLETKRTPFFTQVRQSLKGRLLAGVLVVVPLWLTYVALKFFFVTLDGIFAPLLRRWFGISIPGLGFVLLFVFLYLIGMITSNILGKSLFHFWESILNRIPFVKNIYQGAKQLIHTISGSKTMGFKRVVFIEYPRIGLYAVGFVTNSFENQETGKRYTVVFIPTPPNPVNGIFEIVPERDVIETNLTIEDGIKMVISAGMITPPNLSTQTRQGKVPS